MSHSYLGSYKILQDINPESSTKLPTILLFHYSYLVFSPYSYLVTVES